MLLDKEILDGFKDEARGLLSELTQIIEQIEDHEGEFPKTLIEEFANRTDRIMGAAKTFETMAPEMQIFVHIGKFAELCKATGYKAATLNQSALVPVFAAFWADTLEMMEELCEHVDQTDKVEATLQGFGPVLQKRLTWLAEQIVKFSKGSTAEASINVDGILRRLGIKV